MPGGVVDGVLMRITDGLLAIPSLILAIALAAFLGASLINAMIAIAIAAAPIFIRLTRGQVLAVRGEQYVDAVRTMGFSGLRIIGRHILPNILPVLLVQATLSMADAIIAEAGLSFLGLGPAAPGSELGCGAGCGSRVYRRMPVDVDPAGCLHLCLGVRPESAGRWPPRRSRSPQSLMTELHP
jgi:ABC-type dipeptide/oligopeptide/nickel transport system permease subunit